MAHEQSETHQEVGPSESQFELDPKEMVVRRGASDNSLSNPGPSSAKNKQNQQNYQNN